MIDELSAGFSNSPLSSAIRPMRPTGATDGRLQGDMANRRNDIYDSVATLRSYTFELLERMSAAGGGDGADFVSAVAVRLQSVANQLGAVEALIAPATEQS